MSANTHYLSQDKFDELKEELQRLKTIERKKIAENLEYAKSLGDLSENAEYHEAREKQADLEDRILELEETFKYGEIITSHHGDKAEVGSTVVTKREDSGAEEKFIIVGAEDADLLVGKISHESPLGSELLGHKKGDIISVTTPKKEIKYKIIDIK
jgi:transcription elongation factor GreA